MRSLALFSLVAALGCNGTTGSGLVTFTARAGGASDITPDFDTGKGFHITLTAATLHFGAVYLNMSRPSSGGGEVPCVLPGIYVGEAFGPCKGSVCGADVDLLSPALATFSAAAEGIATPAVEAEVWLSSGDVNATSDATPVITVAGTASKAGQQFPFSATVTIGANRAIPPPSAAMPGANPICKQRIVSPIPVSLTLQNGGTLDVRVDPRGMFDSVDFTALTAGSDGNYVIPDMPGGVGGAFFNGVSSVSAYRFSFTQ